MRYMTFVFIVLLILLFSFRASADPISKSVILNKVMDGSARWESKLAFFAMEGLSREALDKFASKQKIVYPKFESDLLYYRYTYDDKYEYSFYFNYVHNECNYGTQTRENAKIARLCWEDIGKCRSNEGMFDGKDVIMDCYKKSTNCSNMSAPNAPEKVEKKYCEKIYGRGL